MNVIEKADAIQKGVTNGPWTIETWADGRIFAINGRKGDPETYEYDTEVLEADHSGECGCRSSCELTVTMSDADKHFVTEARTLIPELNQTLKDVLESVRMSAECGTSPELTLAYVQQIITR